MKHQLDGTKSMEKLYECLLMMKIDFFCFVCLFRHFTSQTSKWLSFKHPWDRWWDVWFETPIFFVHFAVFVIFNVSNGTNWIPKSIWLWLIFFLFCLVVVVPAFFHSKLWNNIGKWIFWVTKWNKLRLKMIGKHNHHHL